jgi:hypothetical protein
MPALDREVCPSGQRERAVNPSAQPTEVRILPPPLLSRAWKILEVSALELSLLVVSEHGRSPRSRRFVVHPQTAQKRHPTRGGESAVTLDFSSMDAA